MKKNIFLFTLIGCSLISVQTFSQIALAAGYSWNPGAVGFNTTHETLSTGSPGEQPSSSVFGGYAPDENSIKELNLHNSALANCNNWLYLPSQPSAVEVGDLDIPGNQVTVEAMINRTTPYTGGILYAGDIVSKHKDPTDANYLLRPNEAEITTTNGYFRTPDICEIDLNKTYHFASRT